MPSRSSENSPTATDETREAQVSETMRKVADRMPPATLDRPAVNKELALIRASGGLRIPAALSHQLIIYGVLEKEPATQK
jgi:hypothetical protein